MFEASPLDLGPSKAMANLSSQRERKANHGAQQSLGLDHGQQDHANTQDQLRSTPDLSEVEGLVSGLLILLMN
jgi:hypothetical protein